MTFGIFKAAEVPPLPRRCSVLLACFVMGIAPGLGVQARVAPSGASRAPATTNLGTSKTNSEQAQLGAGSARSADSSPAARSRSAQSAPIISPGEFTITADGPGLQLLASRYEEGARKDL